MCYRLILPVTLSYRLCFVIVHIYKYVLLIKLILLCISFYVYTCFDFFQGPIYLQTRIFTLRVYKVWKLSKKKTKICMGTNLEDSRNLQRRNRLRACQGNDDDEWPVWIRVQRSIYWSGLRELWSWLTVTSALWPLDPNLYSRERVLIH